MGRGDGPGGHQPATQSPDFPPCFSITFTSVMTIPRSTALHILVSVRSLLLTVLQINDLRYSMRSILSKSLVNLDSVWTRLGQQFLTIRRT